MVWRCMSALPPERGIGFKPFGLIAASACCMTRPSTCCTRLELSCLRPYFSKRDVFGSRSMQ
jgi:hypothetical protein